MASSPRPSSVQQQHVAFDTNVSSYSQPLMSPRNSVTTSTLADQDVPSQFSGASNQTQQQTSTTTASSSVGGKGGKGKGGKKSANRRNPSHVSPLTPEEVANLANSCSTEEKIVWVARQALGAGTTNGFQKATSTMQRMKRQRARSFKQKEGKSSSNKDDSSKFEDEEEKLKNDTFNVRVAKRMQTEMTEGLQFCNLMTSTIRTILEDIDPENPILMVNPAMIGFESEFASMPSSLPLLKGVTARKNSVELSESKEVGLSGGNSGSKSKSAGVPPSPKAARKMSRDNPEAETVVEGNPNGSSSRKMRKRGSGGLPAVDPELLKMVGEVDENGKKLPKKVSDAVDNAVPCIILVSNHLTHSCNSNLTSTGIGSSII